MCRSKKVCQFCDTIVQKGVHKNCTDLLATIDRPITEYSTVWETIYQSVKLAEFGNIKCPHITVDWSSGTTKLSSKMPLGNFHALLHFFENVGKFVSSSGFKDILFQAGMCSYGSIKKSLSGKAYNGGGS